jgi:anti-sigma regulatory factor (Ser/Thr protein kinase)
LAAIASQWLAGDDLLDFELAVGEALANAVEHGGGGVVHVSCGYERGRVVAEIQDYGAGFGRAGPPSRPPNGAVRGYGLFIMNRIVDEVEFMDDGRRLRLMKDAPRNSEHAFESSHAG